MQVLEPQRRTFQQFLDEQSRSKNNEIGYNAADYAQHIHPIETCPEHGRYLVKMLKHHACPWTCPESGCGFTLPLRKSRASKTVAKEAFKEAVKDCSIKPMTEVVAEENDRVSVILTSSTGRVMPGQIPRGMYEDLVKYGEVKVELVE